MLNCKYCSIIYGCHKSEKRFTSEKLQKASNWAQEVEKLTKQKTAKNIKQLKENSNFAELAGV
jgi:hypothetical protein